MKTAKTKRVKNTKAKLFLYLLIPLLALSGILILLKQKQTMVQYAATTAPTPSPIGIPGNWNLIFADEFNGSSLNTSVWTPGWFGTGITGPANSAETACYNSTQVSEPSDGALHLNLISLQTSCSGTIRPNTGSLISSNPNDNIPGHTGFQYTYGYVEWHVYLPPSTTGTIANWPGTWSDGQSWPTNGENDTMEGLGGAPCFHFHSPSGGPGGCATGNYGGWHTFGSDWEPGSVTYYYDGVQVGQLTTGITSSPQYLIMQNTQGTYGGATVLPATMLVDYVRVWQQCTTNCSTSPTPTITVMPTPTPKPVNLLQNASFEITGTKWLNPWSYKITSPAKATITHTSQTKVDGKYAAEITVNNTNTNAWYIQLSQGNLPVTAGSSYTLSFWAKASKSRTLNVVLQQNTSPYAEYFNKTITLSTSWKQYTMSFTAPKTDTILFSFNAAKDSGNVWIDKVSLQ